MGSWDGINLLPLCTKLASIQSALCVEGPIETLFVSPSVYVWRVQHCSVTKHKAAVLALSQWPVRFHFLSPQQSVKINPPHPCHQPWALFNPLPSTAPHFPFQHRNCSKLWTGKNTVLFLFQSSTYSIWILKFSHTPLLVLLYLFIYILFVYIFFKC